MGNSCNCEGSNIKEDSQTGVGINFKTVVKNEGIPDLEPAPRYFIGGSTAKKKLSSKVFTMPVKSTNGNTTDGKSLLDSVERSNNRRARLKRLKSIKEAIIEKITKDLTHKKSQDDIDMILSYLKHHFAFGSMRQSELINIVDQMFYCTNKEEYLFKQNDMASCFFILDKGELLVEIDEKPRKKLEKGNGFGDLALLYNAPRSASIKCSGTCFFWAIDRDTFKKAIEETIIHLYDENRHFLDKISFFNSMTPDQKNSIAAVLINETHQPNGNIVTQGDQADSYYIIKSGIVSCIKDGIEVRKLHTGDTFGEQALFLNSTRSLSVVAITETHVLSLSKHDLTKLLGGQIQEMIYKNWVRWAIQKHELLVDLTKLQLEKLVNNFRFRNVAKRELIVTKDEKPFALIIILEGIALENTIEHGKGKLLNVEYLQKKKMRSTPKDNIIMKDSGVIAELEFDLVISLLGGNIEEIGNKNAHSHEKLNESHSFHQPKAVELQLSDLNFIKKLGQGHFGHVYLVENNKRKDQFFALKVMSKLQIYDQGIEKYVLEEKYCLEHAQHPFIVFLEKTFQDENNIYFLLEYISGIELFDVIRKIGLLSNKEARFYVSCMILAIEYLHLNNVVYRDLKPENIMVDSEGYLKLIDLGAAKVLKPMNGIFRTGTIIGTPHYIAPEVIKGKGYSFFVDLWAIGICLFEFVCSYVPFGEEAEDPYEIYKLVQVGKVIYPPRFLSPKNLNCKELIDQLLSKIPERRLNGSFAALKAHKYFDDVEWDDLLKKIIKSPYIPKTEVDEVRELIDATNKASNQSKRMSVTEQIKIDNRQYIIKGKAAQPQLKKTKEMQELEDKF